MILELLNKRLGGNRALYLYEEGNGKMGRTAVEVSQKFWKLNVRMQNISHYFVHNFKKKIFTAQVIRITYDECWKNNKISNELHTTVCAVSKSIH